MKVLKIRLESPACSFRYPHFHVGNQPTYRMPPPATIYGHICSAYGRWLDKSAIKFSYNFVFTDIGRDYEHVYQFSPGSGKILKRWGYVENLQGNLVPVWRDFLFNPRLDLYLYSDKLLMELYEAFRSPVYPVVLGRSQDLAGYSQVRVIDLVQADSGYLEDTLLPWSFRLRTKLGNPVIMPQFIDPSDRTKVKWIPYIVLKHRLFMVNRSELEQDEQVPNKIRVEDGDLPLWVDPETPESSGKKRIVWWQDFLSENEQTMVEAGKNTG